ncbi:beta-1,3-galactosyltransferase 5-like [Centruroides sculpturatus]|uniref:beta-1,3-galactosyltransferase 5-like n=1 Tax=Centruroides sculpturatus TaxID=218467 RepID=UPI000C6D6CDA|nr:beta-1,3-galactosyltransferase 5-like [Centruroides sculpturatus]
MGVFGGQFQHKLAIWILIIILLFTYLCAVLWYNESVLPHSSLSINRWKDFPNAFNLSLINSTVDFSTLVDLSNFKFLINNQRCKNVRDLFMVIFVHSAPGNFRKRDVIRETWGSEKNLATDSLRLVFLIGSVGNRSLLNAISQENTIYSDIVQGNFVDSYRNLTYKHVMGLKWITYFCPAARYILKTDDDIFVDIFQLTDYLKNTFSPTPPRKFLMCLIIKNTFVRRSQRSKWRVSFKEYREGYYPTYCAGWAIIMSSEVARQLYYQSSLVPYFWIDDVHVSGTLAKRLGLTHTDFSNKIYAGEEDLLKWLESDGLSRPYMFGQPICNITIVYQLWNKTLQYYASVGSHSMV